MILGIVRGEITSTVNHAFYDSKKLMIVDLTDASFQPTGKYIIAVDAITAGLGERVLVLDEGNGARQIFHSDDAPVRSVIVGIVDAVEEGA